MRSAFARALNRVIKDDRFTVKEMAEEAECSDRHLYNCADQTHTAELLLPKAEKLARWLCEQGETRLSEVFLCNSYTIVKRAEGRADGEIGREIRASVRALAGCDDTHTRRSRREMKPYLDALTQAVHDLAAEWDQLPED